MNEREGKGREKEGWEGKSIARCNPLKKYMMGSSRAETIIDIWFSVSMLVAGTYIVSIHVYGKFLS